jgi:hypothetical protein
MHPSNIFRTSDKFYTTRPPANCKAARVAWDVLAAEGPMLSMRLLDGYWMCKRSADPQADMDEIEATVVARMVSTAAACRTAVRELKRLAALPRTPNYEF